MSFPKIPIHGFALILVVLLTLVTGCPKPSKLNLYCSNSSPIEFTVVKTSYTVVTLIP